MKFEKVSRFKDVDLIHPTQATNAAAGFDLAVAEDTIIPPFITQYSALDKLLLHNEEPLFLNQMASITKETGIKPTLVSTGMKCQLDPDKYLELSVRSSTPLKYWLILANGVGIIDADYYNNPSNEGEIFLQLINLSPYSILLCKGDKIGQGIIKSYYRTEDETTTATRTGGFGSTSV